MCVGRAFLLPSPLDMRCFEYIFQHRLLLFKYDGLEFVEQREVSLPDAAACMQLAGPTLYVGLAKRCAEMCCVSMLRCICACNSPFMCGWPTGAPGLLSECQHAV